MIWDLGSARGRKTADGRPRSHRRRMVIKESKVVADGPIRSEE